jgi:phosphodiesterase/alkaline phosphatase D-like protein
MFIGRSGRHLVAVAAAAAALTLLFPGSALAAKKFTSGVTAGEISDTSAIVWGRTANPGFVRAQVATDASFQNVVVRRDLRSVVGNNNTIQTRVSGLKPNRVHFYRFCLQGGGGCSAVGKFRTAPPPDLSTPIRFAFSGDETGFRLPGASQPFWGTFKAFNSMLAENNHFNIDFGDTIYSDPEVPNAPVALGVGEKWRMYRQKLAVTNMQRIRSATGLYNHWDDHEFINDFSIPEDGRPLYNRGVRAFRNFMPVTYSDKRGIYRSFRWGKNLEIFFLDQRSFRSAKASAGGTCDNPQTDSPDLAPTAPQSTRNVFSALVPSLSEPVSQACKNRINSPNRTYLGHNQLYRFIYEVENSTARWKVVMNELPIQQFYALPYDRWEGYAYERVKLLNVLQQRNIDHLVFLTTDVHAGLANVVRERTLSGDVAPSNAPATAPVDTPYQDFVIGPVGTKPFWEEIDDVTGQDGSGQLISQAFFKPPPPNGMGMACAQGGENSYAEVTVRKETLRVDYKDENGDILLDANNSTPCGPYILTD